MFRRNPAQLAERDYRNILRARELYGIKPTVARQPQCLPLDQRKLLGF